MKRRLVGVVFAGLFAIPLAVRADDAESTCVSCHAEEADPDLSDPVEQWRRSVHGVAEVSCDACHGGDPFEEDDELSMDADEAGFLGAPDWDEVPEFCGSCHEEILDAYSQSVMASQIEMGVEVAVCTTCHMIDGHAISHARADEILTEERCGECHDSARAIVLRDLLEDMDSRIVRARVDLDAIRHTIDTSVLDRELQEIRQRAVVVAHTYDRDRIAEVSDVARRRLLGLAGATGERAREAGFRRRVGMGVVGFLIVTCLGIIRLERDLRTRGPIR